MIPTRASKRGTAHFPELRYSRGPRVMGETGDNSYQTLLGYLWMAVLDRARGLRLFQAQVPGEGPWALDDPRGPDVAVWAEVEVPPLPHPAQEVRHLAFCFDQAAQRVVAYEHAGQVWVLQWNPLAGAYAMRGPFDGTDPVLIWDFEFGYFLPDSDVLLFHLSPARTQVVMRVQRELFATPRVVQSLPGPAYLDQAVALPYQGEVLGSLAADPDATGVILRTDLYPVHLFDHAASPVLSPPTSWDLIPIVVTHAWDETGGSALVTPPLEWHLIPLVVQYPWNEVGGQAGVTPPTAWVLTPVVIVQNLGTETGGQADVSPPVVWIYSLVVVAYGPISEVGGQAGVTPPVQWEYFA